MDLAMTTAKQTSYQTIVRNQIFEAYKEKGYLTQDMTLKLQSVGIDPLKQAVEFSQTISQTGATN